MNIPNIALVGKAKDEDIDTLNDILSAEELTELCEVTLYGADDQPERDAFLDAVEDWEDGMVQGIVCLPMSCSIKEALAQALGEKADSALPVHLNPVMRMASCMGNMPITEAATAITKEKVMEVATLLDKALKNDFFVLTPRIAVLSMNKEIDVNENSVEVNVIAPAVSELVNKGIQVFGPIPAGTFFDSPDYQAYDAVICMYDGQCLDAFRKSSNEDGITLVSNVDVPLALAQPTTILKAFFNVTDAARNRVEYKRPFANPLQKLFHERREDGDKTRFMAKKKGFNPAEHRRENVTFTTVRTPRPTEESASEAASPAATTGESAPSTTGE